MPGIVYARNLQTHHLAMTVDAADMYADTYLDGFGEFVWSPYELLPDLIE